MFSRSQEAFGAFAQKKLLLVPNRAVSRRVTPKQQL
jgi:hypothetical protein